MSRSSVPPEAEREVIGLSSSPGPLRSPFSASRPPGADLAELQRALDALHGAAKGSGSKPAGGSSPPRWFAAAGPRRRVPLAGLTAGLCAAAALHWGGRTEDEPALAPMHPVDSRTADAQDQLAPVRLDAAVARAAAVAFSDGRQVGRGSHFDVRLAPAARAALKSVGVRPPPRTASAARREAALVDGLGRLTDALGSVEGALVALRVDRSLVEGALDLSFGSNDPQPDRYDAFARYLPESARRAAEGPTRYVMALALGYAMQWPVPSSSRVSSAFGERTHPVLGGTSFHAGVDLVVDPGTPIRAMADGVVLYAKQDWVNGKFIKIDHGYGLTSAYVHNSRLLVGQGDAVRRGEPIALSGATGRATGPHLHFQVEIDLVAVDPEGFLERKAPRAHQRSREAEAIGEAQLPR